MVSFKAISRPKTRPVTSPARVFITLWRVIGSVRHSQPRAQGITLHQAGSLERLWLVAWYKAVLQKWFSCILLASQMTSEDTEPGGAMKTNACFLLVKIRWPVPSASQMLLELCFLLWHCHFSTAPRFYEAIMLSYRDSHTQWPAVPAGHPICSLSRIPLCPSTCSAVQEQMCRVKILFFLQYISTQANFPVVNFNFISFCLFELYSVYNFPIIQNLVLFPLFMQFWLEVLRNDPSKLSDLTRTKRFHPPLSLLWH